MANLGCIPLHILACRARRPRALRLPDHRLRPRRAAAVARGRARARPARALEQIGLTGYPEDLRARPGCTCWSRSAACRSTPRRRWPSCWAASCTRATRRSPRSSACAASGRPPCTSTPARPARSRAIVAPYSVRATPGARVSTPLIVGRGRLQPRPQPLHHVHRARARGPATATRWPSMLDQRPDVAQAVDAAGQAAVAGAAPQLTAAAAPCRSSRAPSSARCASAACGEREARDRSRTRSRARRDRRRALRPRAARAPRASRCSARARGASRTARRAAFSRCEIERRHRAARLAEEHAQAARAQAAQAALERGPPDRVVDHVDAAAAGEPARLRRRSPRSVVADDLVRAGRARELAPSRPSSRCRSPARRRASSSWTSSWPVPPAAACTSAASPGARLAHAVHEVVRGHALQHRGRGDVERDRVRHRARAARPARPRASHTSPGPTPRPRARPGASSRTPRPTPRRRPRLRARRRTASGRG